MVIYTDALERAVTPFVGVWIETDLEILNFDETKVTPFVGVWIETKLVGLRGDLTVVTPFVGVWIETISLEVF